MIYRAVSFKTQIGNLVKNHYEEVLIMEGTVWCPICESWVNGLIHEGDDSAITPTCDCNIEGYYWEDDIYTVEQYNDMEAELDQKIDELKERVQDLENEIADMGRD